MLVFFHFFFFADDLNANDNILNSSSFNSNNAYDTNQSHIIQITTSSSLQITKNLKDSTIKQLSKKTKSYPKFAKSTRKKHKRRRKK